VFALGYPGPQADDRQILEISFYVESSTAGKRTFGNHNRAVLYNGIPDYERIISAEASGDFVSSVTNTEEERGRTLVLGRSWFLKVRVPY
jgi:hypothetical protein